MVLGASVNLLANPLMLRFGLIFICIAALFVVSVVLLRRVRRSLSAEISFEASAAPSSVMHTYNAVIQELKQQKHELQTAQQADKRRAKTSENISAAVLSNLPSGVLFFTPDGLVRQANAAAKRILGFASPVGVTAAQLFRQAAPILASGGHGHPLAAIIQTSLRDKTSFPPSEAHFLTPAGEERILDVTLTAVHSVTGDVLGAACLINDRTQMARMQRQQQLRGEISSEMALELRHSVNAISSCAEKLAGGSDPQLAQQLATDIVSEAAHLEFTIGGFLSGARSEGAASGI
jgi:nitrogen fixation/metabolism regulation signal transduction histidine kinase